MGGSDEIYKNQQNKKKNKKIDNNKVNYQLTASFSTSMEVATQNVYNQKFIKAANLV